MSNLDTLENYWYCPKLKLKSKKPFCNLIINRKTIEEIISAKQIGILLKDDTLIVPLECKKCEIYNKLKNNRKKDL